MSTFYVDTHNEICLHAPDTATPAGTDGDVEMSDVMLAMVAVEARSACKGESDLTERVKKAMRSARDHWMVLDPETQLRGALAAALQESEGADREQLETSIERLKKGVALLTALTAGVPIDFDVLEKETASQDSDFENIPIMKLWEATDKSHA